MLTAICCGFNQSLLMTDNGAIYLAGLPQVDMPGLPARQPFTLSPLDRFTRILLPFLQQVTQITTGMMRCDDGSLWAIGNNECGALGLGRAIREVNHFTQITTLPRSVQSVVSNVCLTLVLLIDGSLWVAGDNENGQLGLGNVNNQFTFAQVTQLPRDRTIVAMTTGSHNSFLVLDDGSLWVAGSNQELCLGLGQQTDIHTFTQVTAGLAGKYVMQVFNDGNFSTLVLLDDGTLMGVGKNLYGELGLGHTNPVATFTPIHPLPKDKRVCLVAMRNCSTLIVLDDNSVWGAGWNLYGQLGAKSGGDSTKLVNFTRLFLPHVSGAIKSIAVGNDYTFILTSDEQLWGAGNNSHGALGLPIKEVVTHTLIPIAETDTALPLSKRPASLHDSALTAYRKHPAIAPCEPHAFDKISHQTGGIAASQIFMPNFFGCNVCRCYVKPSVWGNCPRHPQQKHPVKRVGMNPPPTQPIAVAQLLEEAQELIQEECLDEAILLLREAAESGDPNAYYALVECYEQNDSIYNNRWLAYVWYQKAAEKGLAMAQYKLGRYYREGYGPVQDDEQAFHWFLMAAKQGIAFAQSFVGTYYQKGMGIKKDAGQAFQWYLKSAEQDCAQAQYKLALCYGKGAGVSQNKEQAFLWCQKAATQGYPPAQNNLGSYYEEGVGVVKNDTQAFQWYLKAAQQNDSAAQYNVAECYENGKGTAVDIQQAIYWYQKATEQGEDDGKQALQRLGINNTNNV